MRNKQKQVKQRVETSRNSKKQVLKQARNNETQAETPKNRTNNYTAGSQFSKVILFDSKLVSHLVLLDSHLGEGLF